MGLLKNKFVVSVLYIALSAIVGGLFYLVSEDSFCRGAVAVEGFFSGLLFCFIINQQQQAKK